MLSQKIHSFFFPVKLMKSFFAHKFQFDILYPSTYFCRVIGSHTGNNR